MAYENSLGMWYGRCPTANTSMSCGKVPRVTSSVVNIFFPVQRFIPVCLNSLKAVNEIHRPVAMSLLNT